MPEQPTHKQTERPPVIAIMGHIDHGKSTLLDYIRQSNIVAGEAGGITQHISAYEVTRGAKKITFLDTPGHEAFEAMRSRGGKIADIAVLVVSAEEGVKAQTLEALKSIETAGIPYAIAINKIDRPNANAEKTKQTLAENNILVESYGGKIPSVNVSAKTGEGVDDLLDLLLLMAELESLTGNPKEPATGFTLEANRDPKIGVTATVVIKNGTLLVGDFIVVGPTMTRVKRMEDFLGEDRTSAAFSAPVRIFGFTEIPPVGFPFKAFGKKKEAEKYLEEMIAESKKPKTENEPATETSEAGVLEIPIVIKTDVVGTLEAVEKEVGKINVDRVRLKVVEAAVGAINEGDIKLVTGSERPIVLGFNVKVDGSARDLALRHEVPIETFDIIYKLGEWLAEQVEARRPRVTTEQTEAKARILKLFSKNKDKQIIGGAVIEGTLIKGREVKILRRDFEVGRGRITELQEQKIKTSQIEAGTQFGGLVESKIELASGDILETFTLIEK